MQPPWVLCRHHPSPQLGALVSLILWGQWDRAHLAGAWLSPGSPGALPASPAAVFNLNPLYHLLGFNTLQIHLHFPFCVVPGSPNTKLWLGGAAARREGGKREGWKHPHKTWWDPALPPCRFPVHHPETPPKAAACHCPRWGIEMH